MKRLLTLALLLAGGLSAGADHLPAKSMAMGSPEDTLAGIHLRTATWDGVVKKYGAPTKTVTVPNNPKWTGYLWDSAGTRLEIEVAHSKTRQYVDTITVVRVGSSFGGDKLADAGATGRGLKLGDSLEDFKRVYGARFLLLKQDAVPVETTPFSETPGSEVAIVQWMKLNFTLTAGLDAGGKIVALRLRLPACYPGGCQ